MVYDFIVIGAGMAGASAAYELAVESKVLLLEAESQPGYHSTGRSAALFTRNYGTALVRRINALSEPFFKAPPDGFTDQPFLSPRGALAVAPPGQEALLDPVLAASTSRDPVIELPVSEALARAPFLRPDRVARAVYEADVNDINVAAMLLSYIKGFKNRGGAIEASALVTKLHSTGAGWQVTAGARTFTGKTIINAAGAWAEQIGAMAGAAPIGLVAKRRTVIIIDAIAGMDVARFPCVDFAASDAYIKPEAGKFMASPGDATPTDPQDVQPDEMDVAVLADWIMRETLIPVRRIEHSWAGLRTFASDENPVVGHDPELANFVWHSGQGGYGIMMAPALAKAVAALCFDTQLPADFLACGISIADLGPARLCV
ncbi:MAG: FAD-binding oxidoreductase [Rhodobacteraceae bacterium]|nr:FAD-binding oxidoreductase [Paracoccaceae bacterium]